MMSHPADVEEVQSIMLSVELALALNPNKDKNRVVQKVCTHARHRLVGNMHNIANCWRKLPDAYTHYDNMMTKAGL